MPCRVRAAWWEVWGWCGVLPCATRPCCAAQVTRPTCSRRPPYRPALGTARLSRASRHGEACGCRRPPKPHVLLAGARRPPRQPHCRSEMRAGRSHTSRHSHVAHVRRCAARRPPLPPAAAPRPPHPVHRQAVSGNRTALVPALPAGNRQRLVRGTQRLQQAHAVKARVGGMPTQAPTLAAERATSVGGRPVHHAADRSSLERAGDRAHYAGGSQERKVPQGQGRDGFEAPGSTRARQLWRAKLVARGLKSSVHPHLPHSIPAISVSSVSPTAVPASPSLQASRRARASSHRESCTFLVLAELPPSECRRPPLAASPAVSAASAAAASCGPMSHLLATHASTLLHLHAPAAHSQQKQ